jgi:hypothetical protein
MAGADRDPEQEGEPGGAEEEVSAPDRRSAAALGEATPAPAGCDPLVHESRSWRDSAPAAILSLCLLRAYPSSPC